MSGRVIDEVKYCPSTLCILFKFQEWIKRRCVALLEEFVSEISKIVSSKGQKNVKTGQTHPILRHLFSCDANSLSVDAYNQVNGDILKWYFGIF